MSHLLFLALIGAGLVWTIVWWAFDYFDTTPESRLSRQFKKVVKRCNKNGYTRISNSDYKVIVKYVLQRVTSYLDLRALPDDLRTDCADICQYMASYKDGSIPDTLKPLVAKAYTLAETACYAATHGTYSHITPSLVANALEAFRVIEAPKPEKVTAKTETDSLKQLIGFTKDCRNDSLKHSIQGLLSDIELHYDELTTETQRRLKEHYLPMLIEVLEQTVDAEQRDSANIVEFYYCAESVIASMRQIFKAQKESADESALAVCKATASTAVNLMSMKGDLV